MYVLAPVAVTDAVLLASNLAETDHAAWGSGTTYAVGDRVIVATTSLAKSTSEAWAIGQKLYWNATLGLATTMVIGDAYIGRASAAVAAATPTGTVAVHGVFESVQGSNLNNNPVSDAASTHLWWVKVGATNRWKAFDGTISDPATGASDITYTVAIPSTTTAIAFFGLNATSLTVEVLDTTLATVATFTRDLVNTDSIVDWYTFYTWDPNAGTGTYEVEALIMGLAAYAGYRLDITVSGTNAEVGEIVFGQTVRLGTSLAGTEVGFEDYSGKDRDDFGNVRLIEREYSDWASFAFAVALNDLRRVKGVVSRLRATPSVWFADESLIDRATLIYGFPAGGLRVPLVAAGYHIASLEIEGLT